MNKKILVASPLTAKAAIWGPMGGGGLRPFYALEVALPFHLRRLYVTEFVKSLRNHCCHYYFGDFSHENSKIFVKIFYNFPPKSVFPDFRKNRIPDPKFFRPKTTP